MIQVKYFYDDYFQKFAFTRQNWINEKEQELFAELMEKNANAANQVNKVDIAERTKV